MLASTTQEPLVNTNESLSHGPSLRSLPLLEPDDFYTSIQKQYGAYWGTLKFEGSLSNYSNEVNLINLSSLFNFVCLGSTISLC